MISFIEDTKPRDNEDVLREARPLNTLEWVAGRD